MYNSVKNVPKAIEQFTQSHILDTNLIFFYAKHFRFFFVLIKRTIIFKKR